MSEGVSPLLASIPQLVKDRDAAGLVALQDHEDKQVRKAVRKALHTLKSRGVEIPAAGRKTWAAEGLNELRGDLRPIATVDTRTTPGALRFVLSEPRPEEGAVLWTGGISPEDHVLDFAVYQQTDGQRARMLRDWQPRIGERRVDVAWLKGRILWARERSMAQGFGVPRSLNESLSRLGATPSARPTTFLREEDFGDAPGLDPAQMDATIQALGIPAWPPLIELETMLEKAAQIHGDKPQPTEETERLSLLSQSMAGDENVRGGLQGAIAQALDDVAIEAWQEGQASLGRAAFQMAAALRQASEAETIEWAPRLVGYQVASLLRVVGGPDAVRKAMQEQQQRVQAQAHVHGPDCDHDHDHAHDHG